MANYSYETLQRMSAHQWEGLKPGQRKAVRNFNRKEGASEPDMLAPARGLQAVRTSQATGKHASTPASRPSPSRESTWTLSSAKTGG